MKLTLSKVCGLLLFSFLLMSGIIDLDNLYNYSDTGLPDNINTWIDSAPSDNLMDDKIATLGRVLFYDKKLSSTNTVSCASCHQQELAFGLEELQGTGVNGMTLRRPMRLLNLRIYKTPFKGLFWDERASSLEELATQPIKDHIEMGYSGQPLSPNFDDLILQLEEVDYYEVLFTFAFGDDEITEDRIAKALAQFIRSIESYDARFDEGYAMVNGTPIGENIEMDFPNFTPEENLGKTLFATDAILDSEGARIGGGVGCFHCHVAPSFTFSPENGNNGVITEIEGSPVLNITKAPSLRDVFGPSGNLNGPLFHNGQATTFNELLDHYNDVSAPVIIDHRLDNNGIPLNLTIEERQQLEAFVKTLTGSDIYTNEKWSNPFDVNDELEIIGTTISNTFNIQHGNNISVYPNPAESFMKIKGLNDGQNYFGEIHDRNGQKIWTGVIPMDMKIYVNTFSKGLYSLALFDESGVSISTHKFIKI